MSTLSSSDIKIIEDIILSKTKEGKGFIWNFSNSDFENFINSSTGKKIYDEKYSLNGTSKMKRLKEFFRLEDDISSVKILKDLKVYGKTKRKLSKENIIFFEKCIKKIDENVKIYVEDIDFKSISIVNPIIKDIEQKLKDEQYNMAIDRLHTFFTGYIKYLCSKNKINVDNKSLKSLYGQYLKFLYENKKMNDGITKTILTSSNKLMEDFDYVRNNLSPAHFNEIISNVEAEFICNHVLNIFKFLQRYNKRENR